MDGKRPDSSDPHNRDRDRCGPQSSAPANFQAARSDPGSPWRLATLGVELAGAVAGGCLLGYWIDLQFDTGHWGLIIGAGIGIIGGLYNMIRKAVHESLRLSERSRRLSGQRRGPTDRPHRPQPPDREPPEAGES